MASLMSNMRCSSSASWKRMDSSASVVKAVLLRRVLGGPASEERRLWWREELPNGEQEPRVGETAGVEA